MPNIVLLQRHSATSATALHPRIDIQHQLQRRTIPVAHTGFVIQLLAALHPGHSTPSTQDQPPGPFQVDRPRDAPDVVESQGVLLQSTTNSPHIDGAHRRRDSVRKVASPVAVACEWESRPSSRIVAAMSIFLSLHLMRSHWSAI